MPFDGTDYREPPVPRRAAGNENAITVIIVLIAATLLVLPVSLAALVDAVRYVWGG